MSHQFLKNKDIILFALKPWDSPIGTSSKQYARVFANNNNRVLFINRALDRFSLVRFKNDPKVLARLESLKDSRKALTQVDNNIWVLNPVTILESINTISLPFLFDWFNKINNRRLAAEINRAASQLGFQDPVLYIENDFLRAFYLKELVNGVSHSIYYIRDYLPSQDYFKKHGKRLEPLMIGKSDTVITNSVYLKNYAIKYNLNSHFVGQGCDLRVFSGGQFPMPEDMKAIRGPIIGYTGALITTRLDISIIRKIALAKKEWNLVLIGPEDENFKKSDLHTIPNIYFLGRKDMSELPSYVSHFDVCINPQLVNQMTVGNYPLKADEYLAMGKPMVATKTEAMEMFEEYAYLCETVEDYISYIEKSLAEPQTEELIKARKKFVSSHTWENCVKRLDQILQGKFLLDERKQ